MTHTPTRRSVAKGAAWTIPAVTVAAAAPAVAASPCAGIVRGRALPASAFAPGYFVVTNQSQGIASNKTISIAAGISLTTAAASCVGSQTLSLQFSNTGSLTLTNNQTYTVSGGTGSPGTGNTGSPDSSCTRSGAGTAQACLTTISIAVNNSSGTSSSNPKSGMFTFTVAVGNYGTTTLQYNLAGFTQSSTNWNGTGLTFS